MVLCAENLFAQTLAEWVSQKVTQKKYLLQQIAALQVYSGYLSKGYSIAKDGLNTTFNQQNIIISLQRSKEKNDIDVVKKLYGIE